MENLTIKQTYKNPISEFGKNLLSKIETEKMSAKVQFRIAATNNYKYEATYIGTDSQEELIKLINYFGFFQVECKIKTVERLADYKNFYLITINLPLK